MASTDWIYDGRDTYNEYQEVVSTAATQTFQERAVHVFRRHKLVELVANITLPTSAVGTLDTGANLYGYKGAYKVQAATVAGGLKKWVCVGDDYPPSDENCPWYVQSQTWEKREAWADTTWPTV